MTCIHTVQCTFVFICVYNTHTCTFNEVPAMCYAGPGCLLSGGAEVNTYVSSLVSQFSDSRKSG